MKKTELNAATIAPPSEELKKRILTASREAWEQNGEIGWQRPTLQLAAYIAAACMVVILGIHLYAAPDYKAPTTIAEVETIEATGITMPRIQLKKHPSASEMLAHIKMRNEILEADDDKNSTPSTLQSSISLQIPNMI